MSLNGLDAAAVSDAYYAAIVEVGGWFLLRYTNRDSVELLAKGKGGVHEARNELLKYEEKSPLYGLIIYRRRKVLIKYIPDGTSRLLQARTAVHFQAVAERYAPYETILEISNADELSDTSLASSFPLHTASPALSTTRLDEISEDAEDGGAGSSASAPNPNVVPTRANSAKFGTARYKTERRVDQLMRAQQGRPTSPLRSETASNLSTSPTTSLKPSISQFLVREDSGTRSITSLTPSVASVTEYSGSIAESDMTTTKETDTIPSSSETHEVETATTDREVETSTAEPIVTVDTPSVQEPATEGLHKSVERPVSIAGSERSSHMPHLSEVKSVPDRPVTQIDEPFDFSYLEPKPKIKLGPRPVNSTERARKSGGNMGTSLLPSGYLAKKQDQRPKSTGPLGQSHSQMLASLSTLPTPPPIPDVPEYNPRPISRGSVKSMPSQKSTTMTPEKLRLMKAVELRKRQMRKSNPQIRTSIPVESIPEVPKMEQSATTQPTSEAALPPKPDSAIALEHDRRIVDKKPDPSDALDRTLEREKIPEEPAGSLSEPTIASEPASQEPDSVSKEETQNSQPEMATQEQQIAGAEKLIAQTKDAPLPIFSQNIATVPTSDVETQVVEPAAEEPIVIPSNNDADHAETVAEEPIAPTSEPIESKTVASDQNIDEATFSTSLENLITDVPAIVTTASSRPQTAEDDAIANTTIERTPSPLESGANSSMESSGILQFEEKELSDLAKRRRGLVEPLQIDVETRRNSEVGSLSDNDFLEELQSATFHDAKEMVVSKSPGPSASFFPPSVERSESADSKSRSPVKQIGIANGMTQAEGTAVYQTDLLPEVGQQLRSGKSSGSVSPIDRHSPVASLKRNVSSGITKRIQALNELSNREPSAVPVHIPSRALSPDPAPVFLANDRRPNIRSPHSRTGSSYRLRPSAERAGSFPNGTQSPDIPHTWNTSQDTTSNRDSVSVKARIVRPQTAGSTEKPGDGTNDLHESQIEINHSRGVSTPTSVSQAFLPPMPAVPSNPPSPDHRSLHSLRRKSFGRSKAATPGPTPANGEDVRSGAASIASTDDSTGSRTSRFFKRMSTFGSNSSKRRSIINAVAPTPVATPPAADNSASRSASVANNAAAVDRDTPPAVQVGDLNVQFPDTLLWKRRWASLSETGHLHLAPTTNLSSSHNAASSQHGKKFHLSDFKAPYAPDLDQQELPHSICLEFTAARHDAEDDGFAPGGILQLACEDAMGQRQVLRLLGGYWKSWVV